MPIGIFIQGGKAAQEKFRRQERTFARMKKKLMADMLFEVEAEAQQNIERQFSTRSGGLRRFGRKIKAGGDIGETGPQVPYGEIQEKGGTIKPKAKQWLTIPLDAALTPSGVKKKSAFEFADAFFLRTKGGSTLLVQRQGRGIQPLFLLVRSVTLPPRPYLEPALETALPTLREMVERRWLLALRRS
jgi:hypothetical protein